MKRIIAAIFCIFLLAGFASAYVINFEAPKTVESGSLLVITGTSTLPAGFSTQMEFFRKAIIGNKEVATVPFTIQDEGYWQIEVDTSGWTDGEYTMSIPPNSEYSYGGSSNLLHAFSVTGNPPTKIPTTAPTEAATAPQETSSTETAPQMTSTPVPVWIVVTGLLGALAVAGRIARK